MKSWHLARARDMESLSCFVVVEIPILPPRSELTKVARPDLFTAGSTVSWSSLIDYASSSQVDCGLEMGTLPGPVRYLARTRLLRDPKHQAPSTPATPQGTGSDKNRCTRAPPPVSHWSAVLRHGDYLNNVHILLSR